MNVSYKWLSEYVNLEGISPEELAEKMSRTGIEVEGVEYPDQGLKKIVVGHTLEVKPHPDADHLNVCQVDVGEETLQVLCGAENVAEDQKVVVALPGSRIVGNKKIKKSKLRGLVSNGMICSLEELGYSDMVIPKKYADGIYILPEEAIPGKEVYSYLSMDDAILDLSITPNRADALSMHGVAHEVGAIYNRPVAIPKQKQEIEESGKIEDYISVSAVDKMDAPVYSIQIIKDIKVEESPLWLQTRLMNAGIRPLNNIVDITNYILLEYGQPLHAFDYDKLSSKEITVRRAEKGEKLITLDEAERKLSPEEIVITSGEEPIALAGVMGGLDSHITSDTTTVALEAALFDSVAIRKTAKALNLRSEASMRFEKGINSSAVEEAGERAAIMMSEIAGGTIVSGTAKIRSIEAEDVQVEITLDKVNRTLGTDLSEEEVSSLLEQLGFGITSFKGKYTVTIPPRRWDIHIEADLVEEIARIYGYDNLPSTLPVTDSIPGGLSDKQRLSRHTKQFLEGAGLSEAINYALTTPEKATAYSMKENQLVHLELPMSKDHSTLRTSLINGLLDDLMFNAARKNENVALYEMGHVFNAVENQTLPLEKEHLAAAVTGWMDSSDWQEKGKKVDFFMLKGILEGLVKTYGLTERMSFVSATDLPNLHPGRSASILLGDKQIGFVGQLHPLAAKSRDLKETYLFEIDFQEIISAGKHPTLYQAVPKYPGMSRDIALVVDESISHQEIAAIIQENGGVYLNNTHLFDVYQGQNITEDKKSLAYTLTYLNPNATLVEEEVSQAFNNVKKALVEQLGAEIR